MSNQSRDIELEKQIDAYLKGQLSDEEAEQLWVRLMQHPEYISILQTELDLARSYKSNSATSSYYWKWIAAAAAMVVLVLSINLWSPDKPSPIETWAEKEINIAEQLASAEVTRSATTSVDPADSLLNSGFKAAVAGNTDEAARLFGEVVANYDSTNAASKAYLNLGILRYNSGNYKEGIQNFNSAISSAGDDSLLVEQSYWYLSNALVNTGRLKEARDAASETYKRGNLFKQQSFRLMKRLDYELGDINFDNFEQQIQDSE